MVCLELKRHDNSNVHIFFVNIFHNIKRLGRKMIIAKFLCCHLHRNADQKKNVIWMCRKNEDYKIRKGFWLTFSVTWLSLTSIADIGRQNIPLFWMRQPCSFFGQSFPSQNQSKTSFYRLFIFHGQTPWLFMSFLHMRTIVEGGANNIYNK